MLWKDALHSHALARFCCLLNVLTHPDCLILHVDGGDAGSEEQGGPAGYPDSVKVSVILEGGTMSQSSRWSPSEPPSWPAPRTLSLHRASLSSTPKDLTPGLSSTHKCTSFIHLCVRSCAGCWGQQRQWRPQSRSGLQAKSGPRAAFVNKVFLAHRLAHSPVYCLQ